LICKYIFTEDRKIIYNKNKKAFIRFFEKNCGVRNSAQLTKILNNLTVLNVFLSPLYTRYHLSSHLYPHSYPGPLPLPFGEGEGEGDRNGEGEGGNFKDK